MKNNNIRNKLFAIPILAMLIVGQTSVASAGIINWFRGNSQNNDTSSSSNMFLNASGFSLENINLNKESDQTIIQDKFLATNGSTNSPQVSSTRSTGSTGSPQVNLTTLRIGMGTNNTNGDKFNHALDAMLIDSDSKKEVIVAASAYSSTPDQTDDSPFITASGTLVHDGIVAANFLPMGTKIRIPQLYGNKIFTVEDRMNKRYWQKIDIWFPDRESALKFGVKTLKIEIL